MRRVRTSLRGFGGCYERGVESKAAGRIGKIQTGSTPKTSEKDNFGRYIPFIKPADFLTNGSLDYEGHGLSKKGLAKSRLVEKDSVLMVCIGATIGKVGFTEKDVTTNQQINSLTPFDGYSAKFIYYQMLTVGFQRNVIGNAGQTTLPIISKKKWSNLRLHLPPIPEQKRIVAILDEAFAGIATAVANTEKNLTNARELFDSYLNNVFTQKGEGWAEKKLGKVCENLDSMRVPITKSKRESGDIPYYGASGIVDHVADYIFDERPPLGVRRWSESSSTDVPNRLLDKWEDMGEQPRPCSPF